MAVDMHWFITHDNSGIMVAMTFFMVMITMLIDYDNNAYGDDDHSDDNDDDDSDNA